MFWPVVLPVEITFWVLAALVVGATFMAPRFKLRRTYTFLIGSAVAMLGFVPSCIGVHSAVDTFRFGHFQHPSFDDVRDFRIERWLPPDAVDISLFKHFHGNGYLAQYTINEAELTDYLDGLWDTHGEHSAIPRHEFGDDGQEASGTGHLSQFQELGWTPTAALIVYHSPVEGDGGGATYYHDQSSGRTFQRAGYW